MIQIRPGSIEEAVSLTLSFPEFENPYGELEYKRRLESVPHLILLAEVDGKSVGCKVGYEREKDGSFYSWIGGVLPQYRRMGIARLLAEAQEEWAKNEGYVKVKFKTRNSHTKMLVFALQRGFYITGFEPYPNPLESRIWLERPLS